MLVTIPGTAYTQGALPRSITPGGSSLEISLDRRILEETYMKTYKVSRPRLELQGSDALLKRQHRFITRGEIGFIQVKHLTSALPEKGERPTKTSKRFTMDGWEGHEEEEVRSNPTTRRQLERMHMVFRTTLLMCTASAPQFSNLCITKVELDAWYEWFHGEDIAGRSPPPSEAILLYAERNAWRKIHDMVHGGTALSEALRTIKLDLSFWTREVYERVNKQTVTTIQTKGKGKTKTTIQQAAAPWQPQWMKPRTGEPKGKGTTKGTPGGKGKTTKGKSKTPGKLDWPSHWARVRDH